MPTFLRGVSVHPLYQTRCPVPFEEQFSDPTPFPRSVVVSLDFPSATSVAAARFFDKCYATAALGRTVVLVGGFRDRPSNRRIRQVLSQRAPHDSQGAMVLLTFPGISFPAGTVSGWPESPDADEQEHPKFSLRMRFGVPTQPSAMDPRRVNWHVNLAVHPCNTRVILFSPRPSDRAAAIMPERVYHPGMWECDADVIPLPPPLDGDKSPVAKARRQLLALHDDRENPFPKHVVPRGFVDFLRAWTHIPASYAATAAAAIIRAGLGGQFALERARAAMLAHVLRALHFRTSPQSVMSMRGVPPTRDRCHACNTWVVSRWGISDRNGTIARALIKAYVHDRTKTGARAAQHLSINPETQYTKMCWPSC